MELVEKVQLPYISILQMSWSSLVPDGVAVLGVLNTI